ncbi:hypothetical protein N431DRAFT_478299 [Stipitochalara longipes BDJ]|nr:hypothetical protein N431DRAFT_478299 [Stipitochalara longipes BDJ]
MASLQATADSIRAAVGSVSTCTTATATLLSDLLLAKTDVQHVTSASSTIKPKKSTTSSKQKATKSTSKSQLAKLVCDNSGNDGNQLSSKERSIFATEIINITLKTLSDAIKVSTLGSVRRQGPSKDLVKASARKAPRRSNSLPQSPLQPRSLNRVSSSPSISTRESRSSSSSTPSGHRSTAECARIAFSCLRTLQASKIAGIDLPELQLENGMSVLIGKLVSLGLDDLAIKELRILKRRLETSEGSTKSSASKGSTTTVNQSLPELLDFGKVQCTGAKLGLVITTQLQILRLMTSSRRPLQAEAALSLLAPTHPSSPTRLLLLAAKESKGLKQAEKLSRQLQNLSEILLSLTPSVSPADDALAVEGRLSVTPEVAVQLQTLALHTRFLWWGIAGHEGDLSKEIFDPFLRCLSSFARRSRCDAPEKYRISASVTADLMTLLSDCSDSQPRGLKSLLASMYKILGSFAKDANLLLEAIEWTEAYRKALDSRVDSETRRCSAIARMVSLKLRMTTIDHKDEGLLLNLLEELEHPFKGESADIDDLMIEVSQARKSAMTVLSQYRSVLGQNASKKLPEGVLQMCESLVFLCPRLAIRYLGNPPNVNSPTKDIVRYEQRRVFISKQALNSIDSVLFLVRKLLAEGRIAWNLIDSKLQDCILLLNRLELSGSDDSTCEASAPNSHHVRISNLYYSLFLDMRRTPDNTKDGQQLRVLRRSIDSVRTRPREERKAALLSTKLERMAEFCKMIGRYEELSKTLSNLRDELIDHGCLSDVAEMASFRPVKVIWMEDSEAAVLSRTIQSLLRVQIKYSSSISEVSLVQSSWSEEETGVILELQLDTLSKQASNSTAAQSLLRAAFQKILSVYDLAHFPLRRIRVLLRLLLLNEESLEEIVRDVLNELDSTLIRGLTVEGTRDEHLAGYLEHFRAMAISTIELRQEKPSIDVLKESLGAWSSIRNRCEDFAALEHRVDDVPDLLIHLRAIADYLEMKGFATARVTVLRLIVEIEELPSDKSSPDDLVLSFTYLGLQWLRLGYSGKAGLALDRARTYDQQNGVTAFASLQLHISYSQYLLAIGSLDRIEDHLQRAQSMHLLAKDQLSQQRSLTVLQQKTKINLLLSDTYLLYSMLALERGAISLALAHAKQCVRLLRSAWAKTEDEMKGRIRSPEYSRQKSAVKLAEELPQISLSTNNIHVDVSTARTCAGSMFWNLVTPLFHGLQHLSQLYAHNGMFRETLYYAQQAYQISAEVGSETHLAMAAVLLGSNWLKSGSLDKGSEFLKEAQQVATSCEKNRDRVLHLHHLGNMNGLLGNRDAEILAYDQAQDMLRSLTSAVYIESFDNFLNQSNDLDVQMSKITLSNPKIPIPRKTAGRGKISGLKRQTVARSDSPIGPVPSVAEECRQLTSLKAMILRDKSRALVFKKKFAEALVFLNEAEVFTCTQIDVVDQGLALAKHLLLYSVEQMNVDPVYSVLQDSTISYPSVVGSSKQDKYGERLSVTKISPPRRVQISRGNRDRGGSKSPAPDSFFDKLRQAQEHLIEVHSIAIAFASVSVIHKVSALLNSVAILLSAAGQIKGRILANPGFASYSIETARTLARRRELRAVRADARSTADLDESCWPNVGSCDSRRSSFGFNCDMSRFQKDYIDIIPKSWTVISVSLSDSRHELSITKFEAGHSPFILRLPLGRHNSMDADEEIFGFEQGYAELLEVIDLANESAHDAHGRTGREARAAWWAEREALDARLRDLLENIEKVWLGGFTGIFSQHTRRPELLARFQKSFQNILDKHLPSRQKTGKRNVAPRITLDSRILDLFIGLGDAADEDCDFSEPLTDLLYFVVDVLQFHGELNAYAEIDFDSIVVETHDALRSYHEAVRGSHQSYEARHTILILDKALHAFPWESLPCMDGLAVSRLLSLGCLRERIIGQDQIMAEDALAGHYIHRENGSYILNPSGDLKHTQTTFQKPLQNLKEWDGIINREPGEDEIKMALASKDLLLYFGHGSGAQYIRAREIKKLDKCAVTMLMGCSSGALVETGDFEPYGPPTNYMHASCPALVATLWDVTDKDIDRFAKSTFEHWGLFEPRAVGKGKGRIKEGSSRNMSLVEAVARGRDACNLRYLNGASVCVYGVPVYFR